MKRLDQIRERLAGATPGPWVAEYSGEQGDCVLPHDAQSTREAVAVTRLWHRTADAEFIAAAPTDITALLVALEGVLALHFPEGDPDHSHADICFECHDTYPCPTVAAITTALEGNQP